MLISRSQAKLHLIFAVPILAGTLGLGVYYGRESVLAGQWLGGGSPAGLVCGIAAASIILFEMALWPRKMLRRLRLIPAKYWMVAHIWLGIASLPLAILHSGFHWGGWLPATLMVLFLLTIFSGVYGLAVQNLLPKWMLRNLPTETIYSQINYVSEQAVDDVRQLLVNACGRHSTDDAVTENEPELPASGAIVVGAVRQAGKTAGRTLETKHVVDASADRDLLWSAFEEIQPFLLRGTEGNRGAKVPSPVADRQQALAWFGKLRGVCAEESAAVIEVMEGMCEQRRQFDVQRTVHRWLHSWLPVHIGLSVAVSILLITHLVTAIRYW